MFPDRRNHYTVRTATTLYATLGEMLSISTQAEYLGCDGS